MRNQKNECILFSFPRTKNWKRKIKLYNANSLYIKWNTIRVVFEETLPKFVICNILYMFIRRLFQAFKISWVKNLGGWSPFSHPLNTPPVRYETLTDLNFLKFFHQWLQIVNDQIGCDPSAILRDYMIF